MSRQLGQSLVEFACGSAALLLLLLGTVTLSGYQEMQRRGSIAARQMTYEASRQLRGAAPGSLARRAFAHNLDDAGLLDAVGKARYVTVNEVQMSQRSGATPGLAGDAASMLLATLALSRPFTGKELDLDPGGYVSGQLEARMMPHTWSPEPFRSLDISLRQPYAILSDPWNSGSATHVRERTASLVPTQGLASLAAAWGVLAVPLSIVEPSIGRLCLGLIEPDTIPEDRLSPPARGMNTGRICQ